MTAPGATSDARAVLWDLDGTLVDSAEQHWQSWHVTLADRGFTVTPEQFRSTFGQRNDRILTQWLGEEVAAAHWREIGDAKEQLYRELVARDGLVPLPGAAEWVTRLAGRHWSQAIASSAPRKNVEVVVEALGLRPYFRALVAAEDVSRGKPEPEVFQVAAGRLETPPERCVVVEDAAVGIEAARRAGMASIGVGLDGASGADVSVASLLDLDDDTFERLTGS